MDRIATFSLASGGSLPTEAVWLVVVLILWAVSAMSSVLKKAKQPPARPTPPYRPAVGPPAIRPGRAVPAVRKMPALPPRAPRLPRSAGQPIPPPLPIPPARVGPRAPVSSAKPIPNPAAPTVASMVRQIRPQTVRAQFILAEILQPPLALRSKQKL